MTKRSTLFAPIDDAPSCEPAAERIAVRWLPVEALRPNERNARVHSGEQVARIAQSIAAFGFNAPVLVDEKGGVLAGHGRVLAAKRLGLKEVPAIMLDHLGEAQRRAFMIADNRLAELAFWDEGRLRLELEELKNLDLDFAVDATGFTMDEIDLRIEGGRAPGGKRREPGASSPGESAVTRAGDTWTLGPQGLVCGDDPGAGAFPRWTPRSSAGKPRPGRPRAFIRAATALARSPRSAGNPAPDDIRGKLAPATPFRPARTREELRSRFA
jgi:hypothetical protein